VVPFERRPKTAWTSLGSLGAIAAALALIGLIISLLILWQQNRAAQAEVARLAAEVRETSEQLAREREMVALITTPGARMAELAGTKEAPGAHAIVAYDKNGEAMLMAKGLPVAPAGKAYQLWFIKGGKPLPGRVFMSDPNGNGRMRDQVPSEALNDAVFAITLEPASGAQSPTGAIYLSSGS
jgi:anti-sigma-K factor RskA